MPRGTTIRFLVFAILTPMLCTGFAQAQKPSFGSIFTRKYVQMVRKLPPVTDIKGKSISVHVVAPSPAEAGAAAELQGSIENRLTTAGSGVRVEGNNPDLSVECTITHYTSPHYVPVMVDNKQQLSLVGDMNAVFRISEPRTHHLLASGIASSTPTANVSSSTSSSFPSPFHSAPKKKYGTDEEAQLVTDVATQIAGYLVVTEESVEAQIAVDKELDIGNKLALSNLWPRALEAFDTAPKIPDAKLDAYRIYNVGVANEALAYQATDPNVALKYLQEASADYGKALNDNPGEKNFMEPQNRIKRGLAHYTSGSDVPADAPAPAARADAPMTDEDVIAMAQAKLDESLILDAINSAQQVNFDIGVQGLITMSKGGVSGKVITAMKAKQKSAPPAPVKK